MGLIFDIQRFSTHDGPGIRTTVFLKGCPLDCFWCHNPESKTFERQLFYTPNLCIGCGACVKVCEVGAHAMTDGRHVFDRTKCRMCLRCAEACVSGALEVCGRGMTAEEALGEVEKDRPFYEESGGGMTISGGEPMAQFEFTRELLKPARSAGIHTCLETSGWGAPERFLELVPFVDLFLWDIKDTDERRHLRGTRAPLAPLLDNLRIADSAGGVSILRCPIISGVNLTEPHLDGIAAIFNALVNCQGVELLPYHPYGESKLERLGLPRPKRKSRAPTDEEMQSARAYLRRLQIPNTEN